MNKANNIYKCHSVALVRSECCENDYKYILNLKSMKDVHSTSCTNGKSIFPGQAFPAFWIYSLYFVS